MRLNAHGWHDDLSRLIAEPGLPRLRIPQFGLLGGQRRQRRLLPHGSATAGHRQTHTNSSPSQTITSADEEEPDIRRIDRGGFPGHYLGRPLTVALTLAEALEEKL